MAKLLLVEDERDFANAVCDWLAAQGYLVDLAGTGPEALSRLRQGNYDLVILDLNLPALSGLDVARSFRSHGGMTPILMLTGNKTIDDKELGFDAGADDYLTKPFNMRELTVRVKALLKRSGMNQNESGCLKVGDFELFAEHHRVTLRGKELDLLPKEFQLLEFFLRHPGKVFSAGALIQRVWDSASDASPDTIRTYITRLRSKVGHTAERPVITTVHGVGYKLEA